MISSQQFFNLMQQLAQAWCQQDTESALMCFTSDAIYMEPPNIQLYTGHDQLRPYFAALKPGTFMHLHNLWFDEARQIGAGEYSFGMTDEPTADHGIIVAELRDGKIAFWREYQQKGPVGFAAFLNPHGKAWQWHIGNYP